MEQDDKLGQVNATIQEVAHYNMLVTEAIYELLVDRGILSKEEVVERVRKLREETKLKFRFVQ